MPTTTSSPATRPGTPSARPRRRAPADVHRRQLLANGGFGSISGPGERDERPGAGRTAPAAQRVLDSAAPRSGDRLAVRTTTLAAARPSTPGRRAERDQPRPTHPPGSGWPRSGPSGRSDTAYATAAATFSCRSMRTPAGAGPRSPAPRGRGRHVCCAPPARARPYDAYGNAVTTPTSSDGSATRPTRRPGRAFARRRLRDPHVANEVAAARPPIRT